jgi:hypothetical protein
MRRRRIASRFGSSRGSGRLSERARRVIQRAALADTRGRSRAALTGSAALEVDISVVSVFGRQGADVLARNRDLQARWNKLFNNFGKLLVRRATGLSKPTRETGLFMSSWKAEYKRAGQLRQSIRLENRVPYAGFVHRKGERGRTVVETYVLPMVRDEAARFASDLAGAIGEPLKRLIVARLMEEMTPAEQVA